MGHIVSVVSGKGGAGKSTVAVGLARCLSTLGNRVLLVDTDGGIGTAGLLTKGGASAVYNSGDVIDGRVSFEDALVNGKESPDFLPASPAPLKGAENAQLAQLLNELSTAYDYIIADRPAGLDFSLEQQLEACIGLVIASPDAMTVRGAMLAKEGLETAGHIQNYLILNRFLPDMIKYKVMPDIDTLCDTVGAQLIGIVPEDGRVILDSVRSQTTPSAPYNRALQRIARRINGETVPLPKLKKLLK